VRLPQVLRGFLAARIVIHGTLVVGALLVPRGDHHDLAQSILPETCQSAAGVPQVVSSRPSFESMSALGSQFTKPQRYSCVVPAFEAVLRIDPKRWESRYNVAFTLIHTGDRRRAASELGTVITQKPEYLPARSALGLLFQSAGESDGAAEQFKAAL
jgi:tetratricopeptide (TPR) repeat protein